MSNIPETDTQENTPKTNTLLPPTLIAHPALRFYARVIDMEILFLILQFPYAILAQIKLNNIGFLGSRILLLSVWILMLLTEPLFLSKWGTTPGKWLLGITIRKKDGSLLTRNEAFSRTFRVFAKGAGYSIPLYDFYRHLKCYNLCRTTGQLPWDAEIRYEVKPFRFLYLIIFCVMILLSSFFRNLFIF